MVVSRLRALQWLTRFSSTTYTSCLDVAHSRLRSCGAGTGAGFQSRLGYASRGERAECAGQACRCGTCRTVWSSGYNWVPCTQDTGCIIDASSWLGAPKGQRWTCLQQQLLISHGNPMKHIQVPHTTPESERKWSALTASSVRTRTSRHPSSCTSPPAAVSSASQGALFACRQGHHCADCRMEPCAALLDEGLTASTRL